MSTKDSNYKREVKLSDEALKRFRTVEGTTFKGLSEMAALIVETMEGSSEKRSGPKTARFFFGVHVLCVMTADGGCYCYDGKAGVCRPCTGEELSSH
jgi:hypothetical protein